MDINRIIQALLIKNNSVSIAGLGTFSLNYIPAEVYQFSNSITPPSRQLVFSENIDVNDNSLINTLSEEYDLTIDNAKKEIEKWVSEILSAIDQGISFQINEIGAFKKENNKIIFEAKKDSLIFADSFGLETAKLPLIEIEGEVIKENKPYTPIYKPEPIKKVNWTNRILITIIVIFIGIGIFFLFQLGYIQASIAKISELFGTGNKIAKTSFATNDTLSGKIDANTLKRNALRYNEKSGRTGNDTSKSTQQSMQKVLRYYLIAGSFKSMNKAEVLKSELVVKGFTPEILVINDSIYRVSLISFINRHKAVEEYIMLTAGEFNNKLWLFSQLTNE